MLFAISILLMLSATSADSTLPQICEARGHDYDSVSASFGALDAILAVEQSYYIANGEFLTFHALHEEITIDSLQTLCAVQIPLSPDIRPDHEIKLSYRRSGELPDTCHVLIICIVGDITETNLPLWRLEYYPASETKKYEYTPATGGTVRFAPRD